MSGRELVQRVQPQRPAMKVLYMSGYTDGAIVHHGVLDPGIAFLQKPFAPRAVTQKIREVLDRPAAAGAELVARASR
jgi:two-component system cell cycle sensor histidine kinase/response regulator CckA